MTQPELPQPTVARREHATQDAVMVDVEIAGTVGDAVRAGLLHPNCRHSLSAYFPGVTRQPAPQATPDPEGDRARQRLRRLERQIRQQKLVEATALTEEAKRAARARVRGYQGQIRDHVAATGLHRQRYREQLHLANQPPLTDL